MSNSLVLIPILDIQHACLTMDGNCEGDLNLAQKWTGKCFYPLSRWKFSLAIENSTMMTSLSAFHSS